MARACDHGNRSCLLPVLSAQGSFASHTPFTCPAHPHALQGHMPFALSPTYACRSALRFRFVPHAFIVISRKSRFCTRVHFSMCSIPLAFICSWCPRLHYNFASDDSVFRVHTVHHDLSPQIYQNWDPTTGSWRPPKDAMKLLSRAPRVPRSVSGFTKWGSPMGPLVWALFGGF